MSRYAVNRVIQGINPFRVTIFVIIAFLLILDLLAPVLMYQLSREMPNDSEAPFIGLIIGFVVGQIVLLALWGAFGIEPFTKRIPRAMSLLITGCLALLLGLQLTDPNVPISVSFAFAMAGLAGFLLLISPMYALRGATGTVLSRVGDPPPVNRSQFGILNIFVWTSVIAVQISLAKLIAPNSNRWVGLPSFSEINMIIFVGIVCGFFVAAIGVPIAFAILGTKSRRRWISVAAVAACIGPPLTIECISIIVGSRPGAGDYVETIMVFGSIGLGVLIVVSTVLGIVRAYGYRMGYRTP